MKLIEVVFIPIAIGLLTGLATSYLVSRYYLKKGLLDECVRLLKRLCPYRKENIRDGDGLDETSWALQIQSEMLAKRKFKREAGRVAAIAKEIGSIGAISDHGDDTARTERDSVKEQWHREISEIY